MLSPEKVNLTIMSAKYSAMLSKIRSYRLLFCPLGKAIFEPQKLLVTVNSCFSYFFWRIWASELSNWKHWRSKPLIIPVGKNCQKKQSPTRY